MAAHQPVAGAEPGAGWGGGTQTAVDPRDPHGDPPPATPEAVASSWEPAGEIDDAETDRGRASHLGAPAQASVPDGVLVIDDRPANVEAVVAMLGASDVAPGDGFHVVASGSIQDVARLLDPESRLAPPRPGESGLGGVKVVLLSAELQEMPLLAALHLLQLLAPVPVVVIAAAEHEVLALRACRAGAADCVLRDRTDATLLARTLRIAIERRQEELAIAEERRAYRALLTRVHGVAYRTSADPRLAVEWVGENFEHVVGYPRALFIRRKPDVPPAMRFADLIVDEDAATVHRVVREALRNGSAYHAEFRIRHADGGGRWLEMHGEPLTDARGVVVGSAGVVVDISVQKEAQHALQVKEGQLRQAQRLEAVGRLAGGIAHDFNNVLGAMVAHTELALSDLSDAGFTGEDVAVQELTDLLTSANRAGHLTRQLLLFSRQQVPQPVVLNMNRVLGDLHQLLRRTLGVNMEIRQSLRAEHPWVLADRSQVEQIVMNLAVNARDAMPSGGVLTICTDTIELTPWDRLVASANGVMFGGPLAPGRYVALTVADVGHGMTIEMMHRIFEPFFTTKPIGQGTGLGLSTVYGVVTDARGAIRVRSRLHVGTEFTVYLPAHAAPPTATAGPSSEDRPRGTETILLVDDEESMRRPLERMLQKYGYTVHVAGSVGEALRVLATQQHAIDLVVADVMMPGLPGDVLVRALLTRTRRPRILLMSGNARHVGAAQDVEEDIASLVDGFLEKPIGIAALLRAIRATLDGAPAAPAPG